MTTEEKQTTAVTVASPGRAIERLDSTRIAAFEKYALIAMAAGTDMLPRGIKNKEQAMLVMMAGDEWGFEPIASLRQVFVVNGKAQLMTEGMLSLLKRGAPHVRVIWHRIADDGADVELVDMRERYSLVRYSYTETDRARAHQGEKLGGPPKWLPMVDGNGRPVLWPAGHKDAGKARVKINPDWDEEAQIYVDDPESPWTRYRPDMYAWAALKRAIKWGAPDVLNLPPSERLIELPAGSWRVTEAGPAAASLDYVPERSALAEAVRTGEVAPETIFSSDTDASDDTDPQETREEGGGAFLAAAPTLSTGDAVEDAPASPEVIAAIGAVFKDIQASWGPRDYGQLVRELMEVYGWSNPNQYLTLTAAKAAECLATLRRRRGDPVEEVSMTTERTTTERTETEKGEPVVAQPAPAAVPVSPETIVTREKLDDDEGEEDDEDDKPA